MIFPLKIRITTFNMACGPQFTYSYRNNLFKPESPLIYSNLIFRFKNMIEYTMLNEGMFLQNQSQALELSLLLVHTDSFPTFRN